MIEDYKLAIIVPYRDRRKELDIFVPHMDAFFGDKDIDYTIFVVEQLDDRPFNRGKLCNIGFDIAVKEDFDYFCFHDVDMLPITDDCDYSYEDEPIHLATELESYDYKLPYPQYFGGVVLFSKEDFLKVNGYSNEYWGYGVEDLDMLYRIEKSDLPHNTEYDISGMSGLGRYSLSEIDTINHKKVKDLKYITLDGENTLYIKSFSRKKHILENLPTTSYSIGCWVRPHTLPKSSKLPKSIKKSFADQQLLGYTDKLHGIVSRPGQHTGLFYKSPDRIRGGEGYKPDRTHKLMSMIWDEQDKNYLVEREIKPDEWYHLMMVVDADIGTLKMYINGTRSTTDKLNRQVLDTNLKRYENYIWFVGCAYPNSNGFMGDIADLKFYDNSLSPKQVKEEFLDELDEQPLVHIDFSRGFKNTYYDVTGNHFNLVVDKGNIQQFKTEKIKIGNEIAVPIRKKGKYKCLKHNMDDRILDIYDGFDPDVEENLNIFFEDIVTGDVNFKDKGIGLNGMTYKVLSEMDFHDRHKWVRVVT